MFVCVCRPWGPVAARPPIHSEEGQTKRELMVAGQVLDAVLAPPKSAIRNVGPMLTGLNPFSVMYLGGCN